MRKDCAAVSFYVDNLLEIWAILSDKWWW